MEISRIEDKCNECMRCVRDCVAGVWRDVDGTPVPSAPELCNLCSHCVAVCPESAIEHSKLDTKQVRRVKKKLLDPEVYREIVLDRRSVRQYKKKPVDRETIEEILDLARYSPTASNMQNVEYIVVTDRELMQRISDRAFGFGVKVDKWLKKRHGKMLMKAIERTDFGRSMTRYMGILDYYKGQAEAGRDYILHNAPALMLLHAPSRSNFACDNCNIAACNITNYAHTLGLGTCYIGLISLALRYDRTLRRWLDIPKGWRVFASLVMGYPAYSYTHTVSRKQPVVKWI